ncbi:MAG: SDR family oxidoreductase [Clostridia bacterium]|nr:SDR family oxidoreductase [Clostridia bacterium]
MNIVITGSSKGLGFEMARSFLKRGHHVTLSGSSKANLDKAVSELSEYKASLLPCICDVRKSGELQALWDKSLEKLGSVDIWINNAGISQHSRLFLDIPEEEMRALLDTNLIGVMNGTRIAAKGMLKAGKGFIYNMEGYGSNGAVMRKIGLYGTSKCALTYFTKSMMKEMEDTGIKIGLLSPGMMVTDFMKDRASQSEPPTIPESTRKILNILGDRPQTVAEFLVERMLKNKQNGAHIMWLTNRKAAARFMTAPFTKRNIVD